MSKSQGSTFLFMPVVDHLGKKVVLFPLGMPKFVCELAMDNGMKQIWIRLWQSLKETFSFSHWLLFTFRAMSV
ncbi:MAG: hypothetical protein VW297_13430 [Paracoccaceae bacterium]